MSLSDIDFSLEEMPTPKVITCTIEGILEADDVSALVAKQATIGAEPQAGDLKTIREKHHTVARLVASGMQQSMVATICNYTQSYLSLLLNNPSMQELVEHYRMNHMAASEVIAERLRSVAMGAVEKLEGRLADEDMDDHALLGLAKLGLDRSGHGPSSKVHQVTETHIMDHAELQRLNRLARQESERDIIDQPQLPAPAEETEADTEGDDA